MNNDFLVVAFGGLFGSFGVTLLAEIKKYFVNKRDSEIKLYSTFLALYSELVVEVKNAEYFLSEPIIIPDNLFSIQRFVRIHFLYRGRTIEIKRFLN